jgi:hypothetical protein
MVDIGAKTKRLNQTFFKRILIGEDSEILGTTLTPIYAVLASWEPDLGQPQARKTAQPAPANLGVQSANPDPCFGGRGLHIRPMVDIGGQRQPQGPDRSAAASPGRGR